MSKPLVDIDFRPEKPHWEPPQAPPKPNVCLHGSLTMPGGGSLVSPPTIRLDELARPVVQTEVSLPEKPIDPPSDPDPVRTLRLLRNRLSFEKIDEITRPNDPKTEEIAVVDVRLPDFSRSDRPRPETPSPFPRLSAWTSFEDEEPAGRKTFSDDEIESPLPRRSFTPPSVRRPRPTVFRRPPTHEKNRSPVIDSHDPMEVHLALSPENLMTSPPNHLPEAVASEEVANSLVRDRSEDDSSDTSGNGFLATRGLVKNYFKGKLKIPVLKGVDFSARDGEFVSIVGQSGSGKSTLLHLLGTLDKPDAGSIHFSGQRIDNLPISRRDVLRNRSIGFIFQFYHLLPELTTLENVLSPLMIRESVFGYLMRRRGYVERGKELLDRVGLSHRLKHRPSELSGGEMQRAAIARALISDPKVLLADEPTGNLDAASAREIIDLLCRLSREQRVTIIMVTHDNAIAQVADRTVRMVDGVIVER